MILDLQGMWPSANGGSLQGRELTSKVYIGTKLMDRGALGMVLDRVELWNCSRNAEL